MGPIAGPAECLRKQVSFDQARPVQPLSQIIVSLAQVLVTDATGIGFIPDHVAQRPGTDEFELGEGQRRGQFGQSVYQARQPVDQIRLKPPPQGHMRFEFGRYPREVDLSSVTAGNVRRDDTSQRTMYSKNFGFH